MWAGHPSSQSSQDHSLQSYTGPSSLAASPFPISSSAASPRPRGNRGYQRWVRNQSFPLLISGEECLYLLFKGSLSARTYFLTLFHFIRQRVSVINLPTDSFLLLGRASLQSTGLLYYHGNNSLVLQEKFNRENHTPMIYTEGKQMIKKTKQNTKISYKVLEK